MADLIARLKLESGEYDAKIKRAVTGLQQMETECRKVGGTLAILEKDQKQYVQALGQMQTVSTSVRGKIGEMTAAFTDLRAQYNHLTDEEKKGDFGRALSASLDTLKGRIKDAREELKGIQEEMNGKETGGGLFSRLGDKMGGAMQVFAGNMMTKATMAVADFGNEMMEAVQQSVELAKSAEGIRAAYDRLGNAHLMAQLKEETHGTVSELNLMKAAVKFNDFGLPVKELGTMLAFAQQKAKDTGQSVDYMVDSIVTGLGRKSKLILDNLGISAADIDEHMKKTGDMTLAVGEIIREQMGKAGDYIETAADRAAKANADLEDAMLRLGDTFKPLTDSASSMWNSIKIGAIDLLNNAVKPLINALTVAGRLRASLQQQTGEGSDQEFVNRQLSGLRGSRNKKQRYQASLSYYDREIEWRNQYAADITAWQKGQRGEDLQRRIQQGQKRSGSDFLDANLVYRQIEALSKRRAMYMQGADAIFNPVKPDKGGGGTGNTDDKKGGKTTKENKEKELTIQQQIAKLEQEAYTASDERKAQIAAQIQELDKVLEKQKAIRDEMHGIVKEAPEMIEGLHGFNTANMQNWMSTRQKDLAGAEIGSSEYQDISGNIADMNILKNISNFSMDKGIDVSSLGLEKMWEKIFDGENIPDNVWENLVETINEELAKMGIEPIKLDLKTGDIKEVTKNAKGMSKEWQAAASAIQSVGSAMSQIEDPAVKVLGTIAQAIATVALAASQAMAAKDTTASGWAWIGAAAAITATMVSTITAIHSATGYAQGGIVKGNSYSGDNIYGGPDAMVNAGELVLTKAQQLTLATNLQQGGMSGMNLSAVISGEDILLSVNNRLRREGRGELVTSRSKYIN